MNHVDTVKTMFEAFGKGDISTILEHCDNAIVWDQWPDNSAQNAGVPWVKMRSGRAGVGEFFALLGTMTFHEFTVRGLFSGGSNQVAADVVVDLTYPVTGQRARDEAMFLFTFNDAGKVSAFRHYLDTAKAIKTAGL